MTSVKQVAQDCLGKTPTLSVREDLLGVYSNDNPQSRSLKERLELIQTTPFVKVAIVTIQGGANGNMQRDLDTANEVYQRECDTWVYPTASITVVRPNLLFLTQDDCGSDHSVSDEEDELFDIGRNLDANVVGYYINNSSGGLAGCAAHPNGRRGFWSGNGASPRTWAHELGHVVGDLRHVNDSDNLMSTPTASITNLPADLTNSQCEDVQNDPDMESC